MTKKNEFTAGDTGILVEITIAGGTGDTSTINTCNKAIVVNSTHVKQSAS